MTITSSAEPIRSLVQLRNPGADCFPSWRNSWLLSRCSLPDVAPIEILFRALPLGQEDVDNRPDFAGLCNPYARPA